MSTFLLKHIIILSLLSVVTLAKGQVFSLADSIPTDISGNTYRYLPVQSENNFNILLYSTKNKKQNFELITIKDTLICRMEIKNPKLDGGGSWYKSSFLSDKILLLLHVDGLLVMYKKNKKGNFALKKTLNIRKQVGMSFDGISLLNAENIVLMNTYNSYSKEKLYANYALCIYNLPTKRVTYQKEMNLGKGILFSHFSLTSLMESKNEKIAVAHPTLPFICIYNNHLNAIDTISVQFQDTISVDSVINAIFTDSFLERNRARPKVIIETIEKEKINQMERIEKVFWLSDDIVGYTIRQAFSTARFFVFYSISEEKELERKLVLNNDAITPYNFVSTGRILINNNKTIWRKFIYKDDESDFYYKFYIYDKLPFDGTK